MTRPPPGRPGQRQGRLRGTLREALDDALASRHAKHSEFINKVFSGEAVGSPFRDRRILDLLDGQLSSDRDDLRDGGPRA